MENISDTVLKHVSSTNTYPPILSTNIVKFFNRS